MGISGSLNIGGYDKSRVLEPVSSQVYSIDNLPIDLLDVGIGVAEGQSPFNFTSKSGFLASGNTSNGISIPVQVEATVPYLYLPQSTCNAIAQNLPVNFQSNLGLYIWNTTDPQYQAIVASPSFLSFTFRLNSSITQNFTINVPFALLNLTLIGPIVKTPTQYFPCSPGQGPTPSYKLGRAFMQAAFVGVNWQTGNRGLARDAVAGIAVVVIFLVASSVVALFFLHRSRSSRKDNVAETQRNSSQIVTEVSNGTPHEKHQYSRSGYGPTELGSGEVPSRPVEMAG